MKSASCSKPSSPSLLSSGVVEISEMKIILLLIACLAGPFAFAEEYRYNLMVTTGLQQRIFDQRGKETTIVFSEESDQEARFVLSQILELGGINGTKGREDWNGVPFEQALIIKGKLDPEILKVRSSQDAASAEDYQKFTLEEVLIRFPIVRQRSGKNFDTAYLETHFSFETLFPDGLLFDGRKVDFDSYTFKTLEARGRQSNSGQSLKSPTVFPQPKLEARSLE